jgi:hypothetical protein
VKYYRRMTGVLTALMMAASAGMAAGVAPIASASSSQKSAMPEPSRRGRRYMHEIIQIAGLGGGGIVPGGVVGCDWIRRRTNNFRRKGVGSRWRVTMNTGRR